MNPEHALPGYEDAWYYLWKERRLPVNVDPFDSKLSNRGGSRAAGESVRAGSGKVVGYALPLRAGILRGRHERVGRAARGFSVRSECI